MAFSPLPKDFEEALKEVKMWRGRYKPQRTWVGLSDTDLAVCGDEDDVLLARYWERVLKEKNA